MRKNENPIIRAWERHIDARSGFVQMLLMTADIRLLKLLVDDCYYRRLAAEQVKGK